MAAMIPPAQIAQLQSLPDEVLHQMFSELAPDPETTFNTHPHEALPTDGQPSGQLALHNLCQQPSARIRRIAYPLMFRTITFHGEADLARCLKDIVSSPAIANACQTLCSVGMGLCLPANLKWGPIISEVIRQVAQQPTNFGPWTTRQAQTTAFSLINPSSANVHVQLLKAVVFMCPNLRFLSLDIPVNQYGGGPESLSRILGPLVFGGPEVLGTGYCFPPFLEPHSLQRMITANPSGASSTAGSDNGYSAAITRKRKGESDDQEPETSAPSSRARLPWPLLRLEKLRVWQSPDGPETLPSELLLSITPAPVNPNAFTPMWARVYDLSAGSIATFYKILGETASLSSLKTLRVTANSMEGLRHRPDNDPLVRYPVLHIHPNPSTQFVVNALRPHRKTLESLELDLMIFSNLAVSFYGLPRQLIALDQFEKLTSLTLTLQAAFGKIDDFQLLLDPRRYQANMPWVRNMAVFGRFPRSLVSLKLVEYWEDVASHETTTPLRNSPAMPVRWIQEQYRQGGIIAELMKVMGNAAPSCLPNLEQCEIQATLLEDIGEKWSREMLVFPADPRQRCWLSWTNYMSEDEIQMALWKRGRIKFRLTTRMIATARPLPQPCQCATCR